VFVEEFGGVFVQLSSRRTRATLAFLKPRGRVPGLRRDHL
jgi:hypothetical protein